MLRNWINDIAVYRPACPTRLAAPLVTTRCMNVELPVAMTVVSCVASVTSGSETTGALAAVGSSLHPATAAAITAAAARTDVRAARP